jgi:hypothetical protein
VGMKWRRKRTAGVSSTRMVRSGMATCCCGGDCWMSSGGWVVGRRSGSAAPGGVAVDGGVGDDVLLWLWVRLGCGLPLPRFALPPWRAVRLLVYLYATRPCTTLSPSEERSALASWFELQRQRRMVAERTKKGTGIVGRLACPTVGPADGWRLLGWWSRGFGCRRRLRGRKWMPQTSLKRQKPVKCVTSSSVLLLAASTASRQRRQTNADTQQHAGAEVASGRARTRGPSCGNFVETDLAPPPGFFFPFPGLYGKHAELPIGRRLTSSRRWTVRNAVDWAGTRTGGRSGRGAHEGLRA